MKSTGFKTTLIVICTTLICGLFPVLSVKADNVNYGIPAIDDFNTYNLFSYNASNTAFISARRTPNTTGSGYLLLLDNPETTNRMQIYLFGDNTATMQVREGSGGFNTYNMYNVSGQTKHTYNGVTFYGRYIMGIACYQILCPYVVGSAPNTEEDWYNYYIMATTQVNPIDTGAILNISLSTRYVNEQKNNSSQNLDVITWNGYQDSNLNDISGLDWFVDIRARKISYSGNSPTDLLSRTQNEAVFTDDYFSIASVSAKKGSYELTWGDVYNLMDISAYQILPSESLFYTYGWVYEMRLRNADTEDTSDWQVVYTLSSLPPQDTQTFSNELGVNAQATEIIYKVDTQNLNSNTTYNVTYNYINDVPIGSDDYQQDVNGKPWHVILLEGIIGMIQKIIDIIGGAMHDIISGIFGFISDLGVNIVDTFKNIFNGFNTNLDTFNDNLNDVELPQTTTEGINELKDLIQIPFTILNDSGLSIFIWIPLALCVLGVLL